MEEWRDIEGYEGLYQISNQGRLKSLKRVIPLHGKNQFSEFDAQKTIQERIMNVSINGYGYCQSSLYKNGKFKTKLIHQLVARAFIPNPENKPTVNHIDGDKTNNCVDNLEWATSKEQTQHLMKELGFKSVISDKCRKRQIELHKKKVKRSDGMIFNSIKEASFGDNKLRRHISEVCLGKRKRAGGYSWEYVTV